MSLNRAQRAQNSRELAENISRLPVSFEALAKRLGYTPQQLQVVIDVEEAYPGDVWRVRDFIEAVAEEYSVEIVPFGIMTPAMRPKAQGWFGVWDVPSAKNL